MINNGYRVSSGVFENVVILGSSDSWVTECTKSHNFKKWLLTCEFNLNKAVTIKKGAGNY